MIVKWLNGGIDLNKTLKYFYRHIWFSFSISFLIQINHLSHNLPKLAEHPVSHSWDLKFKNSAEILISPKPTLFLNTRKRSASRPLIIQMHTQCQVVLQAFTTTFNTSAAPFDVYLFLNKAFTKPYPLGSTVISEECDPALLFIWIFFDGY